MNKLILRKISGFLHCASLPGSHTCGSPVTAVTPATTTCQLVASHLAVLWFTRWAVRSFLNMMRMMMSPHHNYHHTFICSHGNRVVWCLLHVAIPGFGVNSSTHSSTFHFKTAGNHDNWCLRFCVQSSHYSRTLEPCQGPLQLLQGSSKPLRKQRCDPFPLPLSSFCDLWIVPQAPFSRIYIT